ncbi:MAG: hypothetical protein MUE37_14430 [Bacteroidales bacterium]|nr:hypothetical protein [Bacteroidales bacterium]
MKTLFRTSVCLFLACSLVAGMPGDGHTCYEILQWHSTRYWNTSMVTTDLK